MALGHCYLQELLDIPGSSRDMVEWLDFTMKPNRWNFILGDKEVRSLKALHPLKIQMGTCWGPAMCRAYTRVELAQTHRSVSVVFPLRLHWTTVHLDTGRRCPARRYQCLASSVWLSLSGWLVALRALRTRMTGADPQLSDGSDATDVTDQRYRSSDTSDASSATDGDDPTRFRDGRGSLHSDPDLNHGGRTR